MDPGGKSNPVQPGDNANANSEPNSEQSVSFDEHLKESGTSSIGKNSVSLKRNEIEKCITLLKHAMQCKKADCEKKSCAKQVFLYFQGFTDCHVLTLISEIENSGRVCSRSPDY